MIIKNVINNLPKKIAIFPLSDAVFFPQTTLPLNIFERRYIQLVNDCLKSNRLFGMVQPKSKINLKPEVYSVGCLGKIVNFNETDDGRYIINLSGLIRFKIKDELKTDKLYREFNVEYSDFINDLSPIEKSISAFENKNLINKIELLLRKKNYLVELDELKKLNFDQMINTLCMLCPFSAEEKQKLIETVKTADKVNLLEEIIQLNLVDNFEIKTVQ